MQRNWLRSNDVDTPDEYTESDIDLLWAEAARREGLKVLEFDNLDEFHKWYNRD